jgi:hypothetical protein
LAEQHTSPLPNPLLLNLQAWFCCRWIDEFEKGIGGG